MVPASIRLISNTYPHRGSSYPSPWNHRLWGNQIKTHRLGVLMQSRVAEKSVDLCGRSLASIKWSRRWVVEIPSLPTPIFLSLSSKYLLHLWVINILLLPWYTWLSSQRFAQGGRQSGKFRPGEGEKNWVDPPPPIDELGYWRRVNIAGNYVIYYVLVFDSLLYWHPSSALKKSEHSQVYEMSQISAFNILEGDRQGTGLFISRGEKEKEKALANGKSNPLWNL